MIDKLAWIRVENGKILTARSRNRDIYYIPGGKREAGETDEQALRREISEELTVDLIPESVQLLGEFEAPAHGQPAGTLVRLRCYSAEYAGVLHPSAEIEEMQWLSYADRHRVSEVARLVFDFLHQRGLLTGSLVAAAGL
ncbi:NUDIX hydrolase [Hymenobacter cellulosivorans]|uniref:NUDIX domain-containing protein n=1 Tax=Hymenobacter cellulosivorans TaxID=2932249 RepID=A0ABY4FC46_9BACT|nr:NUDIX domain-containing protein [Hymenobacter cellulosivorans]UOQ52031.1 NUDIX domain-containing protein [Hymenobacter cellulosivorans]